MDSPAIFTGNSSGRTTNSSQDVFNEARASSPTLPDNEHRSFAEEAPVSDELKRFQEHLYAGRPKNAIAIVAPHVNANDVSKAQSNVYAAQQAYAELHSYRPGSLGRAKALLADASHTETWARLAAVHLDLAEGRLAEASIKTANLIRTTQQSTLVDVCQTAVRVGLYAGDLEQAKADLEQALARFPEVKENSQIEALRLQLDRIGGQASAMWPQFSTEAVRRKKPRLGFAGEQLWVSCGSTRENKLERARRHQKLHPDSLDAKILLLKCEASVNLLDINNFNQVLTERPGDIELLQLGFDRAMAHDDAAAAQNFASRLWEHKQDACHAQNLVRAGVLNQFSPHKLSQLCAQALSRDPAHNGMWMVRADALLKVEDYATVLRETDSVLIRDPSASEAWHHKAEAQAGLGQPAKAIASWNSLNIEQCGASLAAKALLGRAKAKDVLNDHAGALEDLRRIDRGQQGPYQTAIKMIPMVREHEDQANNRIILSPNLERMRAMIVEERYSDVESTLYHHLQNTPGSIELHTLAALNYFKMGPSRHKAALVHAMRAGELATKGHVQARGAEAAGIEMTLLAAQKPWFKFGGLFGIFSSLFSYFTGTTDQH